MNALVTGGGGFLGTYIVEQLVARGESVRVLCRGSYRRLDELGVETVRGDVRDAPAVARACRHVETVFHAAALPGIWGPYRRYYETNYLGTRNVLDACRANGVSRLVFTSSPSVVYDGRDHRNADESLPYPEPSAYLCHYARTKRMAEELVLTSSGEEGLATCALRPHLIWGPRDRHLVPRLIRRAQGGRLRRVGDGTNLISMSYVENAAAAHLQAADALSPGSLVSGRAYFINEPEPVNLWEWIDELLARSGLPPVTRRISAAAAYRLGAVLEAVYRLLPLPGEPPMTRFLALQLSRSHYYDVSAARRDFGYDPPVSVEEGLRRLQPELKRLASGRDYPPSHCSHWSHSRR